MKFTQKLLSKMGMQIETRGNELDLVCGMDLVQGAKYKAIYKDKTYYFCSESCQKHFQDNPEKYSGR